MTPHQFQYCGVVEGHISRAPRMNARKLKAPDKRMCELVNSLDAFQSAAAGFESGPQIHLRERGDA